MNLRKFLLGSVSGGLLSQPGVSMGRMKFRDAYNPSAFPFRMGAGSPGTVTRTHPASISAYLNDNTHPLTSFGQAAIFNGSNNDVRAVLATDTTITDIAGISVRPYPYAGIPTATIGAPAAFGGEAPIPGLQVDICRFGSIIVPVSGGGSPVLGGVVYLWVAAASSSHVVGGFETEASSGNTIALPSPKWSWGGPADANGNAEIIFNP